MRFRKITSPVASKLLYWVSKSLSLLVQITSEIATKCKNGALSGNQLVINISWNSFFVQSAFFHMIHFNIIASK